VRVCRLAWVAAALGEKDAQWIARLAEMGLLRPSFVPPPEIRAGIHLGQSVLNRC
jgi:hypothetical protein